MFKPIAWAMIDEDGQFIDAIHPDEHAIKEGDYTVALYREPQPKREPPTTREVKDVLRATGLLTNSQAWDVAEEVMKLLAAHGIKENT